MRSAVFSLAITLVALLAACGSSVHPRRPPSPAACGDGRVDAGEACDAGANNSDLTPDACRADCTVPRCGDGVVDRAEGCDDGNSADDDACRNDCVGTHCGDGRLDAGEDCDDGNSEDADDCRNNCRQAACGDGVVWSGHEACDDGAGNSDRQPDACRTDCTAARCGDAVLDTGEGCDDGNPDDDDACRNDCVGAHCGDGRLDAGEDCDDGNSEDADGCRNNCRPATCGDGVVWHGHEECDEGAENSDERPDACRASCVKARCGDGVLDASEGCDDGNSVDGDACRNDCVGARCGDGIPNGGEDCDDGNSEDGDDCRNNCRQPACGDGVVWMGHEACDDGAANSDVLPDACRTGCTTPRCGDAVRDAGEGCDDGNDLETDDCRNTCQPAACGDGVVWSGHEACDDGAKNSDSAADACRTSCVKARCGDGVLDASEGCDDGNAVDGDACRNDCVGARCGDAIVNGGEDCDDGNSEDGDGCRNNCRQAACGDGVVWSGHEACDDGASNSDSVADACRTSCTAHRCGDGVRDTGEACDDANAVETDACRSTCQAATCGDGVVWSGHEACDDGASNSDGMADACRTSCTAHRCGDGVRDTGEACDDANAVETDACRSTCQAATCGDGVVWSGHEACDDGAANSDQSADACRTTCVKARCGDQVVDTGETCDDGNAVAGDGCDATCATEGSGTPVPEVVQRVAWAALFSGQGLSDDVFTFPLPNKIQKGNFGLLFVDYDHGATLTVSDDGGNAWPEDPDVSVDSGEGNMKTEVYVLQGAKNGDARVLTLTFSKNVSTLHPLYVEFDNCDKVGVSAGTDAASAPDISTKAIKPAEGSRVLQYAMQNANVIGQQGTTSVTSWTAGKDWVLEAADHGNGNKDGPVDQNPYALQQRIAPGGSITPTVTTSGKNSYASIAIELVPAFRGVGPPDPDTGGVYVKRMTFLTNTNIDQNPWTQPFPCEGKTVVVFDGQGITQHAPSDSNGNSWTLEVKGDQNATASASYTKNATCSTDMTIDLPMDGSPSRNTTVWLFDITGADASDPLAQSVTVDPTLETGDFSGQPVITPLNENSLLLAICPIGIGPLTGLTSPEGGYFLAVGYENETDFDTFNNADGYAIEYVGGDTKERSFSWSFGGSESSNSTGLEIKPAEE